MSRSASFDITSIGRSTHVRVAGQHIAVRWLGRAGAEQEGEEEEGHFRRPQDRGMGLCHTKRLPLMFEMQSQHLPIGLLEGQQLAMRRGQNFH